MKKLKVNFHPAIFPFITQPFRNVAFFVSSLGLPTASKVSFRPRLVQLILCLSGWVTWKSTHVGCRIQGLGIDRAITAESNLETLRIQARVILSFQVFSWCWMHFKKDFKECHIRSHPKKMRTRKRIAIGELEAGQVTKVGNSFKTLAGVLCLQVKFTSDVWQQSGDLFLCHYMQSKHQGGGVWWISGCCGSFRIWKVFSLGSAITSFVSDYILLKACQIMQTYSN